MSPSRRRRPLTPEEFEKLATAPTGHLLGPAIEQYLEHSGFAKVVRFGSIVEVWEDVVGTGVASHCRPVRIDGDALVVEADHQGWMTELAFRSAGILDDLTERLGNRPAARIKVHLRTRTDLE